MQNVYTYLKLILLSCIFSISIISCRNKGNLGSKSSYLDTNAFPKKRFSSVALFTLDSMNTQTYDSLRKSKAFIYVGSWGNSFIDSLGKPQTSLYKDYILNAKEVGQLEALLIQQPCNNDPVMESACSPSYKNVFVFYDAEKHCIAQLHICFQFHKG